MNAFLHLSGISEIKQVNKEIVPDRFGGKGIFLDLTAGDREGIIVNIEVQTTGQSFFIDGSLYYWARLVTPPD